MAEGKQHVEHMEALRKIFAQVRSLSLVQRSYLYAHDELDMAVMRMRLRVEGEVILTHEVIYKLHPEEVPVKNADLSTDKIIAQGDLNRTLGTLRYPRTLKQARLKAAVAPVDQNRGGANPQAASPTADAKHALQYLRTLKQARLKAAVAPAVDTNEGGANPRAASPTVDEDSSLQCPICLILLPPSAQCAVMPCGHQVCLECHTALLDQIPAQTAPAHRAVRCPSCRIRVLVTDIATVDPSASTPRAASILRTTSHALSMPHFSPSYGGGTFLPLPHVPPRARGEIQPGSFSAPHVRPSGTMAKGRPTIRSVGSSIDAQPTSPQESQPIAPTRGTDQPNAAAAAAAQARPICERPSSRPTSRPAGSSTDAQPTSPQDARPIAPNRGVDQSRAAAAAQPPPTCEHPSSAPALVDGNGNGDRKQVQRGLVGGGGGVGISGDGVGYDGVAVGDGNTVAGVGYAVGNGDGVAVGDVDTVAGVGDGDMDAGQQWGTAKEEGLHVRGSYSTKIEAIVRRLMYITSTDSTAKVVVFSSWGDMLDLLAHALAANHISHALAKGRVGFQKSLAQFKRAAPVSSGPSASNGGQEGGEDGADEEVEHGLEEEGAAVEGKTADEFDPAETTPGVGAPEAKATDAHAPDTDAAEGDTLEGKGTDAYAGFTSAVGVDVPAVKATDGHAPDTDAARGGTLEGKAADGYAGFTSAVGVDVPAVKATDGYAPEAGLADEEGGRESYKGSIPSVQQKRPADAAGLDAPEAQLADDEGAPESHRGGISSVQQKRPAEDSPIRKSKRVQQGKQDRKHEGEQEEKQEEGRRGNRARGGRWSRKKQAQQQQQLQKEAEEKEEAREEQQAHQGAEKGNAPSGSRQRLVSKAYPRVLLLLISQPDRCTAPTH
eukprot:gene18133-24573_t